MKKIYRYLLNSGTGLKYQRVDGVPLMYIVPVQMHVTASDDFWHTETGNTIRY